MQAVSTPGCVRTADTIRRLEVTGQPSLVVRKRVLLVDDEEAVRSIIARLLEALGVTVVEADSGARALELYRQEVFDLVLTDYNMPQMKGDELARAVKRVNPEQRLYLITGYAGSMCEEGSTPAGFDGVILKPFTLQQLFDALSVVPQPQPTVAADARSQPDLAILGRT